MRGHHSRRGVAACGLQQSADRELPKCLLRFGGMSLLETTPAFCSQKRAFMRVVLALGFRHGSGRDRTRIGLRWQPRPEIVLNPRFELGQRASPFTRWADAMTARRRCTADGIGRRAVRRAASRRHWLGEIGRSIEC